jgi:hypothetical protein
MSFMEVVRRIAPKLQESNIPYMITGSIAASYYGLPRATQDLDIVISAGPNELNTLIHLLPEGEYFARLEDALDARRHESMFNVLDMTSGWKIDLIFRKRAPFHVEAFGRRKAVTFEGVSTFMISGEDLILAKLEWSKMGESERQLNDAAIVLEKRSPELDRTYIEKWAQALDLTELWNRARALAGLE